MDLNEVIESFYVESFEGLELMENGLLNLSTGVVDPDGINEIFRAAHSIKGGGGVFGFVEISDFMHGVETLLDQLRSGQRDASNELTELLLQSVDCVKNMFKAARNKQPMDIDTVNAITAQVNAVLSNNEPTLSRSETSADEFVSPHWDIEFRPDETMPINGNDPLRFIKELSGIGEITTNANLDKLPDIRSIEPKNCYISWNIALTGQSTQSEIVEVFSWVTDECDLNVTASHEDHQITHQQRTQKESNKVSKTSSIVGDTQNTVTESIRVSIDKIDNLINLVGELVITQSMLSELNKDSSHHNM